MLYPFFDVMLIFTQLTNNGPLLSGKGPEEPQDKLHGTW
jgi:hypothetical protein